MERGRMVARRAAAMTALLVGVLGGAAADDGSAAPTVVRTSWSAAGELALPARTLRLTDAVPPGVTAPMHSEGVRYAIVPFGDATLALGVDLREGSERIWIDHDLDGDLGNDARAWWTRDGDGWTRAEHVLVSDARSREQAYVEIRVHAAGRRGSVMLSHALCRTGSAEIGGRMRDVMLLDGDHDARFGSQRDRVLVDLDGDGQLDAEHENVTPGRPFRVAAEGWLVEPPSPSGAEVLFARSDEAPTARPRTWSNVPRPPSGVTPEPPDESLDELLSRFEARPRPNVVERLDLVARIGCVGSDRAFAALMHRVRTDHVASVRAAAARAMGNPRFLADHVGAVVQLTDATTTGDPSRCVAALDALHAMDWPERGPLLRRLLGERRWMLAGGAARHLAYLPDSDARAAAIEACTSLTSGGSRHASWHDRLDAYRGVRTIPGGPSPELMVAMAQSGHPALITLALSDLRSTGHPETRELARRASRFTPLIWNLPDTPTDPTDMSPYTWDIVNGRRELGALLIRLLGSGDDAESIECLLRIVVNAPQRHRDALRRQLAARRSPESVAAVMRGLTAHHVVVREVAAEALASVPGGAVTDALVARLDEERSERVRFTLFEALRVRRDSAAVEALLARAEDGPLRGFALRAAAASAANDARVRRVVLAHLRAEAWEQRVRGVLAARESRATELVSHLLPLLSDERWSVRVATIDTLRLVRTRASVAPLVAQLAVEERLRLRLAIADALFALTGMDLGADVEPWRAWHDEHGDSFVVPTPVPTRRPAVESTTAAFFGLPVSSDHATFVLDRSGSMRALMAPPARLSRLHASMDETTGAVAGMPDDAFVNLVLFHMSAKSWKNRLVPLTKRNRVALRRRVRSALLGPQTDVFRALRTALRDPESDTILLLTDGLPNTGDRVEPTDLLQIIARMNETSQVAIHCVSLGTDPELLRRLAMQNAGRHVRR